MTWLVFGAAFDALQELAAVEPGFSERDFMGFAQSQFAEVEGADTQLEAALRIRTDESRALDPRSPEAARDRRVRGRIHYALGGLLVNRRADADAERHFRAALELDPGLEDARVRLGNVLARAGDLEAAISEYSRVLERNPNQPDALLRRGAALQSLERRDDARVDLERLRAVDPSSSEALLRLAKLDEDDGDPAGARTLLRAALELDLDQRELMAARARLGDLELELGSPSAALEQYGAALALDGSRADLRFSLANTLGRLERYDEAILAYREVIAAEPEHEQARLGEATALVLIGRDSEARSRLEQGLTVLPESLGLAHALARLLATANDRAVRDGARAVEQATSVFRALPSLDHAETLAMALAQSGRFTDAVEVQERLVAEAESRRDSSALPRLRQRLDWYGAGQTCCDPPAAQP